MSVKRCILRFFAIILFVLGVQNIAHAASSDECTGQTDTKCINIYVAADNKLDPKTYIYTCTYDEVCYAPANCVEGETCNSYNGAFTTKYTKPGYKFVGWACSGYSKCDELDRDDYIDGSSGYGELNVLFGTDWNNVSPGDSLTLFPIWEPTECEPGYYLSDGECKKCSAGYYCPGRDYYSVMKKCPIGSYSNTDGASTCDVCIDGTTTSSAGATSCDTVCDNIDESVKSLITPHLTLDRYSGAATVQNSCTIEYCNPGYSLTVANYCVEESDQTCKAGYYLPKNKLNCQPCKDGYYCPGGTFKVDSSKDQGRESCPTDYPYTATPIATKKTECYTDCEQECLPLSPNYCPENATCKYLDVPQKGRMFYSEQMPVCSVEPKVCTQLQVTCNAGYYLDGDTCKPYEIYISLVYKNDSDSYVAGNINCKYGEQFYLSYFPAKDGYMTVSDTWKVFDNENITPLATPGYFTCDYKTLGVYSGPVELNSEIEPISYRIEFNSNGGTGDMPPQYRKYDDNKAIYSNLFKRSGYTFNGWYEYRNGETYAEGYTGNLTAENADVVTLYAQWKPNEYTITLDNNGATESGATTLYTRYGDGVYLDAARKQKMTTDNHSIEIPKKYWTITYDANGGSAEKTYDRITVPFTSYSLSRTAAYSTSYINTNGFITADGLSAAQAITDNTTWYAKWNTNLAAMTSITLPRARRTGYTLYSWYTDIDGTQKVVGKAGDSYTTTGGDVTLYAHWNAVKYTITYEENGGSDIDDKTYYITSKTFSLPTPIRDGYTFGGWYSNADLSGESVTEIQTGSTGDKTFWAKWTPNKYNVTYYCGYDTGTPPDPDPATYNEEFTMAYNTCVRDGYTFNHWLSTNNDRLSAGYSFNWTYTNDKTFIAQWTPNTLIITYTNDSETLGTQTCTYDDTECTIGKNIELPGKTGYSFNGWRSEKADGIYKNGDDLNLDNFIKKSDNSTTFEAQWTPNEYTITLDNNGATESGTTTLYTRYGDGVYLDAARTQKMTTDSYSITVPQKEYTVTFDAKGGNVSSSSLTAKCTFNGYKPYGDGTYIGSNAYITNDGINAATSYTSNNIWYAQWSDGTITLPTPTRNGYTFAGWYNSSDNTLIRNPNVIVPYLVQQNMSLYAQWEPAPITITYQCEGETVDTQTCYVTDTECKLKEPTCTKNGYNFDRWAVQAGTYAGDYYAAGDNLNGIIEYLATQDGFWTDGANITAKALWEEIACGMGQYLNNDNECVACTVGSYCPGNNVQYACPVEFTSADDLGITPTSPENATSSNDCYIEKPCPNGTGTQTCNYRSSDEADYVNCNACEYTSCDTWFELVDDNSRCQLKPKFTITTTPDTADFFMHIAAAGEFIIDWGGAGKLTVGSTATTTATTEGNVSTITKKLTTKNETLSSTKIQYTYNKPGTYTIKMSGLATGYYTYSTPEYSAFRLSILTNNTGAATQTNNRVASISGSLSAIFPTINNTNPSFNTAFDGCSSLSGEIPSELFKGLTGRPSTQMFRRLFAGCENLSGTIPADLFADIKTNPLTAQGSSWLFYATFVGCSSLSGEIPGTLFENFVGAPQIGMFSNTFNGCTGITAIGDGLFDSISGKPAERMFADTFNDTSITSIPNGLFDNISGEPAQYMFFRTFGNTKLTTPTGQAYALPADLFENITGPSQEGMFNQTFINCSGLTGYISPKMFAWVSDTDTTMNRTFEGTNIAQYCPANMYVSDSWTAEEKNSAGVSIGSFTRVACDGCPFDTPYSADKNTEGINSCYTNCTLECTQQDCPANSVDCENIQSSTDGQAYYGSTCNAPVSTCEITFSCEPGYKITDDGTACEKETYTATYDCNGGVGGTSQSIVFQDTFAINNNICTREDHDFLGYTIDGQDVTESFAWEWPSDKTLVAKWKKNIVTCNDGYYLPANTEVCEPCPENHACVEDTFKINQPKDQGNHPCPTNSFTDGTGNSQCECFEQIDMDGFVALRQEQYVEYYEQCEYNNGITDDGHECEVQNGTCNITECKSGYEMVSDNCQPCRREHALSYMDDGYCTVKTCTDGFHPISDSCEPNTQECDIKNITNAIAAQQIWNYANGKYGDCIVTECANGYHISENACVQNNKGCEVDNGTGIMTWNEKTQKWNDCMVVSCDSGFTNDPTETNETWKPCGECNNKYAANGELAVSRYGKECEIEECMYKDEKYILENNECRLICDTHDDETGRRYWDERSKRCVHECDPGYNMW